MIIKLIKVYITMRQFIPDYAVVDEMNKHCLDLTSEEK